MKRLFAPFFVALIVFVGVSTITTSTAYAVSPVAERAADHLYQVGLFKGTGINPDGTPIYDLDKAPSRNQALIMLVRLLGKEDEALNGQWNIPFTDVSNSMIPYVGYAYNNGLTSGLTKTTFGGGNPISATQYIAFLLRALGYQSGVDFSVSKSWELSNKIGLTFSDYSKPVQFTRGHIATLSDQALQLPLKNGENTLIGKLVNEGAISRSLVFSFATQDIPYSYFVDKTSCHSVVENVCSYINADGTATIEFYNSGNKGWIALYSAPTYAGPYKFLQESSVSTGMTTCKILRDNVSSTAYYKLRFSTEYDKSGNTIGVMAGYFCEPFKLEDAPRQEEHFPEINRVPMSVLNDMKKILTETAEYEKTTLELCKYTLIAPAYQGLENLAVIQKAARVTSDGMELLLSYCNRYSELNELRPYFQTIRDESIAVSHLYVSRYNYLDVTIQIIDSGVALEPVYTKAVDNFIKIYEAQRG